MERYNLIENGIIHTDGLKLSDAEEMLERYEKTYPDIEFWIEPMSYRLPQRDVEAKHWDDLTTFNERFEY